MFDRYQIQPKPTEDLSSVDENEEDLVEVRLHSPPHQEDDGPQVPADESREKEDGGSSLSAAFLEYFKYGYSWLLLLFSVVVVMSAIFTNQTTVSESTHPVVAFAVLWGLVLWLAVMEGGQGCLVGLQPVDKDLYANSHPLSHKCTALAHKDDNMERFIVGRQFLVVLVVFGINACGSAVANAEILGLPKVVVEIFLASGLALILMTTVVGQLTAQVNAAHCMLDFVNNYLMLFTTHVALAIESSGLLHAVYLVQILFEAVAGTGRASKQSSRPTIIGKVFFWARVFLSVAVLGFALAVTLAALFEGKTEMWAGVPEPASVSIFFFLMCFVGIMEGMQIAFFAVINLPIEALRERPIAHANCLLVFRGSNFQAFLIGRQMCVTICMFMAARITAIDVDVDSGDETVFGVPAGMQEFFNTGLLGAVITTIVGSLAWRVVASLFPLAFVSNPLISVIIRLCLFLEASGLCAAAWGLAWIHKRIAHLNPDRDYIGESNKAATSGSTQREVSDRDSNGEDA